MHTLRIAEHDGSGEAKDEDHGQDTFTASTSFDAVLQRDPTKRLIAIQQTTDAFEPCVTHC